MTRAQRVRLGAFLLVGGFLLGGSILVLAGLKVWERRDRYTVRFTDSVAGLEESSTVRYRGFRVGRVEKIGIAADDPRAIEVTLAIDPAVRLYEGTLAVLDMSGLTGLRTVNLMGGEPTRPLLAPGSRLPTDPGFMGNIVDQAESVATHVNRVAGQLALWTRDENRERAERLLTSLDSLAKNLDILVTRGREPMLSALDHFSAASEGLADVAREGATTLRTLRAEGTATLQAVRRPLETLDPKDVGATVKTLRSTLATLDQRMSEAEGGVALKNLNTTLVQVNRLLQDMDVVVRASREDFTRSLAQLRQASEDIREFSRTIAQDPSSLLRGRELRE